MNVYYLSFFSNGMNLYLKAVPMEDKNLGLDSI